MFPDGATLPANPSGEGRAKTVLPKASARVLMPNRNQLKLRASDLESLVPPGHRARIVWGYVERQDLSGAVRWHQSGRGWRGTSGDGP